MDLGDAMLHGGPVEFFGVLAIANLAVDADELALLESLRKTRKVTPRINAVPLGAAFVIALVVLPAVLGGDAKDNVLLLVLVRLGFSVVTDATDEECAIVHFVAPVLRDFPLGAVHACPEGVPARPTPKATAEVFRKGTQACLGGRSPKPERREAKFGGRACVRRAGCTERGTLNASTVESPIWSYGQFA